MTIVDIAKEAGYSVSTVSRVLNGRRDVSEEARDRIMRIVEAYQFVPNNNAKHLKHARSLMFPMFFVYCLFANVPLC